MLQISSSCLPSQSEGLWAYFLHYYFYRLHNPWVIQYFWSVILPYPPEGECCCLSCCFTPADNYCLFLSVEDLTIEFAVLSVYCSSRLGSSIAILTLVSSSLSPASNCSQYFTEPNVCSALACLSMLISCIFISTSGSFLCIPRLPGASPFHKDPANRRMWRAQVHDYGC